LTPGSCYLLRFSASSTSFPDISCRGKFGSRETIAYLLKREPPYCRARLIRRAMRLKKLIGRGNWWLMRPPPALDQVDIVIDWLKEAKAELLSSGGGSHHHQMPTL